MKYLIVSGDSYTDNDFRSSCYPDMDVSWPKWPELLGKKLNMKVINLAQAGSGNDYIYSRLLDTIQEIPKEEIGLVIAAWSQAMRQDYQTGELNNKLSWRNNRMLADGDLLYWVRRSLRIYSSFEILCQRYDLPYMQFQKIDLYKDYIDGLPPTEQEIIEDGKDFYTDRLTYPGDKEQDEINIMKLIMNYDKHLDTSKFMGWPITRTLGGWPVNRGVMGWNVIEEEPYVIDETDNHPNAKGQELIAEYIHDWLG